MATLDSLAGDQRAALQLVLGGSRSYAQIAGLLKIDPSAVRDRALAGLDALGPASDEPHPDRGLVADYLLGQLSETDAEAARRALASSESERTWAQEVSAALAPIGGDRLPAVPEASRESPVEAVSAGDVATGPEPAVESSGSAVASSASEPAVDEAPAPAPTEAVATGQAADAAAPVETPTPAEPLTPDTAAAEPVDATGPATETAADAPPTGPGDEPPAGPPTSRRGGMVLLGLVAAIVIAAVLVLALHHGSKKASTTAAAASTTTSQGTGSTSTSSTNASSTTSSTSGAGSAKVITQINLAPTASGSKAAAIADVLQEGTHEEIAIVGQNVPANTSKDFYAVWLYNSAHDAYRLGFVSPGVTSNGKLSAAGSLPSDVAHYKELIVTTETSSTPTTPGPILLEGKITGLS